MHRAQLLLAAARAARSALTGLAVAASTAAAGRPIAGRAQQVR